jgi:hypothetical protein
MVQSKVTLEAKVEDNRLYRTSRGNSRILLYFCRTTRFSCPQHYPKSLLTVPCPYRQQRFGRLLKVLKSADPDGNAGGGTPKPKPTAKRATPSKRSGIKLKNPKANTKHTEEEDDEEEVEDELHEEETPTKKHKSRKLIEDGKWKSIFKPNGDVVKIEDGEDGEDGAATAKAEDELDGDMFD